MQPAPGGFGSYETFLSLGMWAQFGTCDTMLGPGARHRAWGVPWGSGLLCGGHCVGREAPCEYSLGRGAQCG